MVKPLRRWTLRPERGFSPDWGRTPWAVVCYQCGATVAEGSESRNTSISWDRHTCTNGKPTEEYVLAQDDDFIILEDYYHSI